MDPNYGTRNKSNYVFLTCIEITLILASLPSPLSTRMQIHTGHVTDVHCDRDSKFLFSVELLKRDQTYHDLDVYVNFI